MGVGSVPGGISGAMNKYIIWGYSTNQHLLIDADNKTLKQAIWLGRFVQNTWPVGDCLVLKSSERKEDFIYFYNAEDNVFGIAHVRPESYHLVFDAIIGWSEIKRIIYELVEMGIISREFYEFRLWRNDLTLRISGKVCDNGKVCAPPRPVAYLEVSYGYKRGGIEMYVNTLQALLNGKTYIPPVPVQCR